FEAHGVCATLRAAKFFGVVPGGTGSGSNMGSGSSGIVAPYISIVSPADGEQVTGNLTVVVAAGDDVGGTNLELQIDDKSVGMDREAPYQFTWDASAAGAGTHTLVATASDGNGNVTQATAKVTVPGPGGGSNGSGDDGGGLSDLPSCSLDAGKSDFR